MIRQRGAALSIAMIALVAMVAAGAALLGDDNDTVGEQRRAHWQRVAMQSVDAALNEAQLAYLQMAADPALNIVDRNRTDATLRYYATEQALDADGIPRMLTAAREPGWSADGPAPTGWPGESIDRDIPVVKRYLIERLCAQPGPATVQHCKVHTRRHDADCDWVDGGGCLPTATETLPYVRLTVRVDAPGQTVVYGQLLMKGE